MFLNEFEATYVGPLRRERPLRQARLAKRRRQRQQGAHHVAGLGLAVGALDGLVRDQRCFTTVAALHRWGAAVVPWLWRPPLPL